LSKHYSPICSQRRNSEIRHVARTSVRGKTLSIRLYTIMKGTLFIWATSETLLLIIDRVPWLAFYRVHCQLTQNFLCLVLRQLKPQVFYYGNLVFECKKRSSERLDVMSGLRFKLKSVTIKASEFNLPETCCVQGCIKWLQWLCCISEWDNHLLPLVSNT